jgi:hypothetical protein
VAVGGGRGGRDGRGGRERRLSFFSSSFHRRLSNQDATPSSSCFAVFIDDLSSFSPPSRTAHVFSCHRNASPKQKAFQDAAKKTRNKRHSPPFDLEEKKNINSRNKPKAAAHVRDDARASRAQRHLLEGHGAWADGQVIGRSSSAMLLRRRRRRWGETSRAGACSIGGVAVDTSVLASVASSGGGRGMRGRRRVKPAPGTSVAVGALLCRGGRGRRRLGWGGRREREARRRL